MLAVTPLHASLMAGCLLASLSLCHLSVCVCVPLHIITCVCVCLGEDAQHGARQGLRRGSGNGQSVAADPTVRGFSVSGVFSVPLSAHAAQELSLG